ncbi:MAG: hypothetical protein WD314_06070 [Trueperaceae bacterium]
MKSRNFVMAAVIAAMLQAIAVGQDVLTVTVLTAQGAAVPRLTTSGFNIGNSMRVVGFEADFEAIRIDSLRFPPGNQADEITVGRPDLAALSQNLELLGRPQVLMVANLFGGTPEGAAEFARLAADMDIQVFAWEIGNEPDLYATNRNDASWTPGRYCREFRRYAQALREVDPRFEMAGPAVSGSRPGGEEFLREVLRLCGDAIDILTWHIYPTDGTWTDDEALATSGHFSRELTRYREWAADRRANPLGFGRPLRFGVTEFGLSWRSSSFRHLEDMAATLWLADVLGQMTAERLDLSHYFTLQGMGGHGLIDTGGWLRSTYHLYRMMATFTGESVPVRAREPLRAYAVAGANGLQLLLINRGATPQRAELLFEGSPPSGLEITTLSEQNVESGQAPATTISMTEEPVLVPARAIVLVRETTAAK